MNLKNPYGQLIFISLIALYFAYFVEYVMQINTCPLCIYQRFPYLLLIFISLIAIAGKNYRTYNRLLAVVIIFAIILATYHTGIERGWFELSSLCKPLITLAKLNDNISVHDFQKLLYTQNGNLCNQPVLTILGFSLTQWNLSLNFVLLLFLYKFGCKTNL